MEFRLPDIGEGVAEGEIVKWLVEDGDSVQEDQPIVEVMTDKATVEIPSPVTGVVRERKHPEGAVVPVDEVLVVFDTDEGASSKSESKSKPAAKEAPAKQEAPAQKSPAPAEQPQASGDSSSSDGSGERVEFKLPDIGEGVAEGEIVKWLVSAGDSVKEDQPLLEVMTDKATVEIPSPTSGTIEELKVDAGQTVPVGGVLVVIQSGSGGGSAKPASSPKASSGSSSSSAPTPQAAPSGNGASQTQTQTQTVQHTGRILAAPATRKLAREMGIDLQLVPGTGPRGRITKDDLDRFQRRSPSAVGHKAGGGAQTSAAPARPAPVSVAAVEPEREERVPFRGLRRKIAESMTRSMYTAVHFTYVDEVDVTELVEARAEAKAFAADQGVKLTYLPYIVKSVVAALKKFPIVNTSLDDAAGELVYKHYYHIGIATDTPNGLVVPVIKNADQKSLLEIAGEITDLATRARDGKLKVEELRGSTFTITNAGNIGGLFATPVINHPEVAIMGVHQIKERPVIKNGEIVKGKIMYLSISLDHRVVDGAVGAHFMNEVIARLENPGRLLLELR
ncbi:MAG: 2-oxoglutarate dehydrogenase, E2 component, dihydrolipoamide succinyltransferase [Planctomycetota bacterium]